MAHADRFGMKRSVKNLETVIDQRGQENEADQLAQHDQRCPSAQWKHIDKSRLIAAPDCGLGHLPRWLAIKKLKTLVKAVKDF